jgi:hypothetical protein
VPRYEVTITIREHAIVDAADEMTATTKAFALREERGKLPYKGSSTSVKLIEGDDEPVNDEGSSV